MRNFIVSDLHGDSNAYDSIMAYLENVSKESDDDLTLFINGDLIDRGSESASMLVDVMNRVNNGPFKIEYLGGNHELMMWQTSLKRINGNWPLHSNWFRNGGDITAYSLKKIVSLEEEYEIIDFVSNLKIYHKFEETLNSKNIVLVHAKCPHIVKEDCNLRIKDNNIEVNSLVWTRKESNLPIIERIGHKDYFTIIGHTPLRTKTGYEYYRKENYLNIDGGCAGYVIGLDGYDHIPLVEIDNKNNRLIILTFNNNNEIIYGNYFIDGTSIAITDLNRYRKYIDSNVKIKKLIKQGGVTFFK